MRKGFTMIELIFVIVIIGILAAVAIPKLTATRDDAKVSAEVASLKQVINNMGSEYTSQNKILKKTIEQANQSLKCFAITPNNKDVTDGKITVTPKQDSKTACTDTVFTEVKKLATESGLLEKSGKKKLFEFGGTKVVR